LLARKAGVDWGALRARWPLRRGDGPLFIAGSTHAGEEEVVLAAFDIVRKSHRDARLILAPRHPERAPSAVAASLPRRTALLTELEPVPGKPKPDKSAPGKPVPDWDVVVVNRIGALFDLYAYVSGGAGAAFVGGSLVPKGGQNPLEPALFGLRAAHGPDMADFPDAGRMDAVGAALEVRDAGALAAAWLSALAPDARVSAEQACQKYFGSIGGGAARSWAVIERSVK
jgi:3-deoxy-D-manno-octulosonic-acid transferase